ncbi:Autophagy protein 7 [Xanthoria calcicola]
MLKFATFTSDIELPFYTSLANLKINHDKLDDSSRQILGLYEIRPTDAPEASCRLQIHGNSLTSDAVAPGFYRAEGMIKNVNTIEDYRNLDKTAILTQAGRTIWDAIRDGTIYSCPSLLASFVVLSYADLKKYKFTYLFGFPALHSEPVWKRAVDGEGRPPTDVPDNSIADLAVHLSGIESTALVESVQTWRYSGDARQYGFFLAKKVWKQSSDNGINRTSGERPQSRDITPEATANDLDYFWVVGSLAQYEVGFFDQVEPVDQFVCFADPSTYKEYPGWMLRNLLVLIDQRWGLNKVQILCYRDIHTHREDARSMILGLARDGRSEATTTADRVTSVPDLPRVSGWERSATGKISSKVANLGEYMNPQRLADQAVDLNLKLIKWRISPGLDLDIIKRTKCLLLGAGTLGSYVARNLLGWGVRKITFVDNGSVSFSNPVRQPLFNFEDCLNGGAKKAHRAAEALREIYPGVETEGHVMSVPMAGHPIMDEPAAQKEYEILDRLIHEHDAIFLLMDTRESRWLPTVMGKSAGKIVMNAALGFDSFVVMRHGLADPAQSKQELGCYFCSDVVAPADSMTDRTLDQQCTVTRPGIAAIASALLVEIMVSVLQHPLGGLAPAPSPNDDRGDHPLGVVPHQIRGFLSTFQNLVIKGNSYDCCSACSSRIVEAYNADGWHFVKRALNEKGYVEELSGLAEVQRSAEQALADMQLSDDSDVMDDGEGEII